MIELAGILLVLTPASMAPGAALPPQDLAFPEVRREWAIKQVLPPEPDLPGNAYTWFGAMYLGDADRDGKAEFYLDGFNWSAPTGTGRDELHLHLFQDQAGSRHQAMAFPFNRFVFTNWYTTKAIVLLRKPGGFNLVFWDSRPSVYDYSVWDLDTGAFQGIITFPVLHWWSDNHTWAGDVDGDGWDDFFFQSVDIAGVNAGLVDGRTLSVTWMASGLSIWHDLTTPTPWVGNSPSPDIDQDGHPDFLTSFTTYYGGSRTEFEIHALSGIDGSTIWWQSYPNPIPTIVRFNSWGADASGDGFPDIYTVTGGLIAAIDGMTGQVLWERDDRVLDDKYLPGARFYGVSNPVYTTLVPGSPDEEELVVVMRGFFPGSAFFHDWWRPVHLDRLSGQRLAAPEFPKTMEPWWWETFMYPEFDDDDCRLLGDIDRDGIVEIARHRRTFNYPGTASSHLSSFAVILGLRTLFVPEEAPIGHIARMTVSIPSGPGKTFYTLASTQFDPDGGLLLDDRWPTFLAPSFLLNRTLTLRPMFGTLDTKGEARLQFGIPAAQALVGTKIYTRVVVEDPSVAGGIWTLSTLGVTEITN